MQSDGQTTLGADAVDLSRPKLLRNKTAATVYSNPSKAPDASAIKATHVFAPSTGLVKTWHIVPTQRKVDLMGV